ncbi:hypothetical protein M0805_007430 [Coniferiporia weirii]|nr:hypothetical protein M0805_007430 [Coniferiporia weirii]
MTKRKTPSINDSPRKRILRSAAATPPPVVADLERDAPSPPRRSLPKRRGPRPEESELADATPEKVSSRQNDVSGRISRLESPSASNKENDDSEADEFNFDQRSNRPEESKNTPRKMKKRVIFDYVEIVTPRRLSGTKVGERRTLSPTPTPMVKRSSLKKPLTKPISPVPGQTGKNSVATILDAATPASAIVDFKQLPKVLPSYMHKCLDAQKHAILNAFRDPPLRDYTNRSDDEDEGSPANITALRLLGDLLIGTIERSEGNSCVMIGPSGSGKSKVFENALSNFKDQNPVVIRLNGHVQHSDRLAMREIARQVVNQTGSQKFESLGSDDDNPFIDNNEDEVTINSLPPPSHLPSLIAALPTLSRPVVVLLDAFDRFTDHPRQALLYCLLDTVQSCRAGTYAQCGLAVIGLTARVDVVNLLEKRVKSRFSHRMLRTASMRRTDEWIKLLRECLCVEVSSPLTDPLEPSLREWSAIWECGVDLFINDKAFKDILKDMFGISRDIRILLRAMTNAIVHLSPSAPYLTAASLQAGFDSQQSKPQSTLLLDLSYPSLSLLIAAHHTRTAGHDIFTFEMLYELFTIQVRTSSAAPVMLGGGGIGMANVGRRVMMGVFEDLVRMKVFLQATAPAVNTAREFVKYRCVVDRMDVKAAVERVGQTNLKKWLSKAQ